MRFSYAVVSGSPSSFYLPMIEMSNLRALKKAIELDMSDLMFADDSDFRHKAWHPNSRIDKSTGYNGLTIDGSCFSVRVHRYARGANEIDLSEKTLQLVYFVRDLGENAEYTKRWQFIRINNAKDPVFQRWFAVAHPYIFGDEAWTSLEKSRNSTVIDTEYFYQRFQVEKRIREMSRQRMSELEEAESYGGTC